LRYVDLTKRNFLNDFDFGILFFLKVFEGIILDLY